MEEIPFWETGPNFWTDGTDFHRHTVGQPGQKNRVKNDPELPNLTAYEDYNKLETLFLF